MFDPRQLENQLRQAQRQAEAEWKRQVDQYNRQVDQHNREVKRALRERQRQIDDYNRRAEAHNRGVLEAFNRDVQRVNAHNAKVDEQKNAAIRELGHRLAIASSTPRPVYTVAEQALADRVQGAISQLPGREWDVFLSYARIDGAVVGDALRLALEALGVSVWFDEIAIRPGKSQALQMDRGLQKARAGIALLTPAYLTGRFWTERELGALLHKATLIPVLHEVTFDDVAQYSGILPDLAGFETARDSVETIAQKIAPAVLLEEAA